MGTLSSIYDQINMYIEEQNIKVKSRQLKYAESLLKIIKNKVVGEIANELDEWTKDGPEYFHLGDMVKHKVNNKIMVIVFITKGSDKVSCRYENYFNKQLETNDFYVYEFEEY